jgi:hypothetical protein
MYNSRILVKKMRNAVEGLLILHHKSWLPSLRLFGKRIPPTANALFHSTVNEVVDEHRLYRVYI